VTLFFGKLANLCSVRQIKINVGIFFLKFKQAITWVENKSIVPVFALAQFIKVTHTSPLSFSERRRGTHA